MPSLLEILKDPNYINANPATKEAIFNRYAPQDENFKTANEATQNAIRQRFGLGLEQPEPVAEAPKPVVEEPVQAPVKPTTTPVAPPEDEGFFARNLRYAKDAFTSGIESFQSGIKGEVMATDAAIIQGIEKKYGPGAVSAPPDVKEEYAKSVKSYLAAQRTREDIQKGAEAREQISPIRPETAKFRAAMGSDVDFMTSMSEAWDALKSNPPGVIADIGIQSLPASLYMVASAAIARLGLKSPAAAPVAGGMASMTSEFGNEYAERIAAGESHDDAWKNASIKSGVIGVFDAVSLGSAGKAAGKITDVLTKRAAVKEAAKEVGKETAKQAGYGAAGEAVGSLAVGEIPNPAAVLAEAVGEVFGAPLEGAAAFRKFAPSEAQKKLDQLKNDIADIERQFDEQTISDEERAKEIRQKFATDFEAIYKREATNDELDTMARLYEQRKLAEKVAGPDTAGRIEPSLSISGEPTAEEGVTEAPAGAPAEGVGVSGMPAKRTRGRKKKLAPAIEEAVTPTPELATALAAVTPSEAPAVAETPAVEEKPAEVPAAEAPTVETKPAEAPAMELPTPQKLEKAGAFENQAESVKGVLGTAGKVYGVDVAGKVSEITNEDELNAFHEANKDEKEPEFTRGDAGYYLVPPEREAPAVVPDAETIKSTPDSERTRGYLSTRDAFIGGGSDVFHIDSDNKVTPVTSLEQLGNLSQEWAGDPDAGFWTVPKAEVAPTAAAAPNRIIGMITQATGPSYDAMMATTLKSRKAAYTRLYKLYSEGKINAQQFVKAAIKMQQDIELQEIKDMNKGQRLKRGADIVRKKIIEAANAGKISRETAEFLVWFVTQNPQVANELAIKVSLPKSKRAQAELEGIAGFYTSAASLIRVVLRRDPETGDYHRTDPLVAVHEVLHHMERMMPTEFRQMIRKEWQRQLTRAAREADMRKDPNMKEYLGLLMNSYMTGSDTGQRLAQQYIMDGRVDKKYYALMNPSEFWAVNASDILYGRYKAESNFAKLRQWVSEFIQGIKNFFGLNNNHAIVKGLNEVLGGEGTIVSRYVMEEVSDDRTGVIARKAKPTPMVTPFEEGEKKLLEIVGKGSKLKGPVLNALANNDLNGALQALAGQTKGFYSDLAKRLAELNLPTTVVLNDVRMLIRRQITEKVGFSESRLFDYIQRTYPELYKQYFENYDRQENIEKVFEGLKAIEGKYDVKPIISEYESTLNEYNKNMKGVAVPGAYFPAFDAISLDTENATYDVFLHEVLHAATEAILNADLNTLTPGQKEAIEALEDMFEYAKAQVPVQLYGFTDIHEFVSELFTNKAFRERLQKIQYKPAKQPLLTQIARAIYKLFGVDNLAGNAMAQATQLFSAVRTKKPISIGPRFAGMPKRDPKKGPATGNWRAQEDYGTHLLGMISQMNKDGVPWSKISKDVGKALFRAQYSGLRRIVLPGLGLRHLSDLTKWAFPQLQGAVRTVEKMLADRNRHMTEGAKILREWLQLQRKSALMERLMSRVMVEATIRGVDPATSSTLAATDPLAKAWAMLPAEYKAMYKKVQQYYINMLKETLAVMKDRVRKSGKTAAEQQELMDEIDRQFGLDKLVYPYFPLRRFGKFWFQIGKGNYKEFVEFESETARNLAMERARDRLVKNGRRDLAETIEAGNGMSELYGRNMATTQIFQDIKEIVDNISTPSIASAQALSQADLDKFVDDAKADIKDALDQLLYIMLPQNSMRKMFINRQGIQGASADMLRVFATTSVHSAYQLSRFKYAEEFKANLTSAIGYIRDKYKGSLNGAAYRDFILEVENRDKQIMSNEDTSIVAVLSGKASQAAYFYMLTAPVTALVNILGFPQLVLSTLGGDYGFKKTGAIATGHMLQYLKSSGSRTIVPLAKGQFLQAKFPSLFESGYLSPELQRAADVFMEENDVNISQTSDIMGLSDRPSELYTGRADTIKRVISEPFHQSERLMREIGLITAFQLAYEKMTSEPKRTQEGYIQRDSAGNPMMRNQQEAFEDAIQEARDKIGLTLGDFNRPMKPRYLSMPGISVLMIFKTFAIYATYAILRNSQVTMFGPLSKSERNEIQEKLAEQLKTDPNRDQLIEQRMKEIDEYLKSNKKESLRRMLGITGTSFLLGGLAATPFFSILMPIIAKMFNDDDDDEFFDWETWFRNWCQETLGGYAANLLKDMGASEKTAEKYGKNIGLSVARGPVGTAAGVSLSDRVSLDLKNLWIRDPRYTPDARQDIIETGVANAGPFAGLVLNHVDAYKLFNEGHYHRAAEKVLPAFMSKPLVAERLAREGAKTKSGDQQIAEFTSWEIAMQAVGLQPERLALVQKGQIAAQTKQAKIKDTKDAIMDRLWLERGNEYGTEKALERLMKFNQKYPELAVDAKDLMESFKKRAQDRMEAEAFGARIDKKLRGRLSPMLETTRQAKETD